MENKANNTIKSVSSNQHEIIRDIITLHNNGNPIDADITYSTGNFYGTFGDIVVEQPKFKFDVAPMDESIVKIEPWGPIKLGDSSIHSCMFDPPFVISPRNAPSAYNDSEDVSIIFKRFSGYYPVNELLDSYYHWLCEIYRVLEDDGIAIVKCQPTVTGGKELNSHHFIWFIGECLGFDMIDEFILTSKGGRLISSKIKKQQHARKYHSYFYVLKKSTKKKVNYFNFMTDDMIESLMNSFVINNKGKKNGENNSYKDDVVPQRELMNKI